MVEHASSAQAAGRSWLERGRNLLAKGDTAAALTAYTEAVRADPKLGAAYLGLSQIRLALDDEREAEFLLSRAINLPDVRAEALARRARLYLVHGRLDPALADLQAAAEADPSPARLTELATFFVEHRAWVAALATYRRLWQSLPADTPQSSRAELDQTILALGALSAEADAVQHRIDVHNWVRRALQRHALPILGGPRAPR